MDTLLCPKCGIANPANAMNCRNCRINLRFALEHPDQVEDAKHAAISRYEAPPQQAASPIVLTVLRWIARILSIVFIGIFILMFIGEGFDPAKITRREWISLLFFPFGVVIGMILAWWKEGLGGAITVASLLATSFVGDVSASGGAHMVVCASPGFLFLFCWFLSRVTEMPNQNGRETLPEPPAALAGKE